MLKRNLKGSISISLAEFERERDGELAKKVRAVRHGAATSPDRIYRIGPNQDLIGNAGDARPAARARARRSPTPASWQR